MGCGQLGQCVLMASFWPAFLLCRAHCFQLQTPHHCIDAAELEGVQRREGQPCGVVGPGAEVAVAGMKQSARLC